MDDKLMRGPKDFPKDCDAIELLKYKSFAVSHSVVDEELIKPNFSKKLLDGFRLLLPLNTFMNKAIADKSN